MNSFVLVYKIEVYHDFTNSDSSMHEAVQVNLLLTCPSCIYSSPSRVFPMEFLPLSQPITSTAPCLLALPEGHGSELLCAKLLLLSAQRTGEHQCSADGLWDMDSLRLLPPTVHISQKERKSEIVIISHAVAHLDRTLFLTKCTLQEAGLSLLFTTNCFLSVCIYPSL